MSSYNKLNGEYTQQNHQLLTTILRNEWGFDGLVMTDWGCKDSTAKAVKAGNELLMPGNQRERDRLLAAVECGVLTQTQLDQAVRRVLEYIVKTPRYRRYPFSNHPDLQAHANDVAVIVLGRIAGEGADRVFHNDFQLTAPERELIQNVSLAYHKVGKRVVAVLNIVGVVETASWKDLVDAIILPWTPGQEGAHVVADIIKGNVNPSGKLPMTFPVNYMDLPSASNFPYRWDMSGKRGERRGVDFTPYEEGIWVGYRHFVTHDVAVSYPFGYGLSYTTFDYGQPQIKAGQDGFTATITVTNTGNVPGREVVQLYVSAPAGGLEKPSRELKAFAKTKTLMPGESERLTMTVTAYDLASFNESTAAWETAAGAYVLQFGASSTDIRQTAQFKMKKALAWAIN